MDNADVMSCIGGDRMARKKKWFHVEIYLIGGASFDCIIRTETIKEARRRIEMIMDRMSGCKGYDLIEVKDEGRKI